VGRDIYSAYLGLSVSNNLLDIRRVQKTWPSAEPLLQQPVSELPLIRKRSRRKSIAAAATPHRVRADRLLKGTPAEASAKGSDLLLTQEQPSENPQKRKQTETGPNTPDTGPAPRIPCL
jgi:hypothetical protein